MGTRDSGRSIPILLVEDDPDDVQLARIMLAPIGTVRFELECADRLSAALERLTARTYSLILLDLTLPDSTGLATLERILERAPQIPIIVLTGRQDESLAVLAVQQGAQDYLFKGRIDGDLLIRSMHYAIERKRIEEELRRTRDELDFRVRERTVELTQANASLQRQYDELLQAEDKIRTLNMELAHRVGELHSLLDAAPICMFVAHDPACQRVTGNRCSNAILGVNEATNISLTAPPEVRLGYRVRRGGQDLPSDELPLQKAVRQGIAIEHAEFEVVAEDGRSLMLEGNAVPLFDAHGKVRGGVAAFLDVTERKRAEEERRKMQTQIQQVQKLESLGVLAGGIAHDFNNLLTVILGNANLADMELPPESPARRTVREIEKASLRAAEMINQMLAYSGKGRFVVLPINLSRLVEEMARLLQTIISKRAVLRFDFAPDLPATEADVTQLRQVVMNLITNASEALGDDDGFITLRTGVVHADRQLLNATYLPGADLAEGPYVYLEVSDTGCGMDADELEKIFDPFFTTKFTGRGLGLAAVLGIVRGHKGAIHIASEPKRGTTFKVLFPASHLDVTAVEATETSPAWRGTGTILVVDDEETVRGVARKIVEAAGLRVLEAADGRAGLEMFRLHGTEVALVLLDLTMPHLNGEEAFREMRLLRPDVNVVLMSGYNEQEATKYFIGKGLAGFLQKPFRANDLLTVLQRTLGQEPAR